MPVDSGEADLCTQVVWNTGGRDLLATSPDSPPGLCPKDLQRQRAGAGLHNLGNTCFLNSVLQCLTYTPLLASYLLSLEHSQLCEYFYEHLLVNLFVTSQRFPEKFQLLLHVFFPSCRSELLTSFFLGIGEHFQLGMQENAHAFLCYTVDATQRACPSGSSNLDISSQATTIVHQIFGCFLRSRVTCFSCKATSNTFEAFLDIPLDIKAASCVTGALEDFVKPEQLDGENGYKCGSKIIINDIFLVGTGLGYCMSGSSFLDACVSVQETLVLEEVAAPAGSLNSVMPCSCKDCRLLLSEVSCRRPQLPSVRACGLKGCEQLANASKRLTIHHSSNVLTVCLKRFDAFSGRKISKLCIQMHCNFVCLEGDISQRRILF
ncbi:ubiquitin carboxyl-terminal hydrolase 42-like [Aquila chrysaetos chrysaetos]|uniref:ubiquitin carboxyl-terminal hydrolase 42-like n=1 Tax=Aquila chrysaetos chrysaetos TaxID=223781 RepID=UPI00117676CC|nr:ubiquitin carboxyl-terminal hydrolase 42-like [Aquila chrysaetos chrysaetos]